MSEEERNDGPEVEVDVELDVTEEVTPEGDVEIEAVETETEILWRREQIGPAYHARFIELELSDSRISALAFVADHSCEHVMPDLSHAAQVRILATGAGFMGTSHDYLANVARHFAAVS